MPPRQCGDSSNQVSSETTPLLKLGGKSEHVIASRPEKGPISSPGETPTASSSTVPTTAALALTMLVQSFLLVGVFPYSGFLAMHLVPSLNEENAGRCAGLIASSFMVGRTLTSFYWGKAADRYGRTFTIKASLLLSAVFSVLFGLAPTLPLALAARFALGLSNGIVGSIKTIIMEISHGDKSKETKTMAIVMGMWGYGFLINPALSGYLSDPVRQYPDSKIVGLLGSHLDLTANPFLLPNLAGCLFCVSAYFCVSEFVEETLPADKIESFRAGNLVPSFCKRAAIVRNVSSWGLFKHLHVTDAEMEANEERIISGTREYESNGKKSSDDGDSLPRWVSPSPSTTALAILSPHSSAMRAEQTPNAVSEEMSQTEGREEEKEVATIKSLMARQSTRKHLLLYWFYSFLVIAIDETFPLYCISKYSGLGVEEKMIGNLLSGAGSFYILIQYFLLTSLVDRYGFYKSMKIGALFSIPVVCLLPLSLITNRGAAEGTLTWSTIIVISIIYATARACSSVVFSTLTMTTNRTVPAHQRAAMNGLSMLGASIGKAAGPAFAGLLFSESVGRIVPPYGSVVVWIIIASMGLAFFVQTVLLPEHVQDDGNFQGGRSENAVQIISKEATGSVEESSVNMADGKEERPPSL